MGTVISTGKPVAGLNRYPADWPRTPLVPGKVVTVFPDRMERYFTTELFRPYSG